MPRRSKGNFGQGNKAWGPATESILFFTKSDTYTFNQPFTDYTQDYIDTAYRHVEPDTGRRYRLVSMIGPGGAAKGNPRYEVMGVTRYWRYSKARMAELIAADLVIQSKPGAVPHRKYYLDEGKGVPVQSLWDDIGNLQASDLQRSGYPTQKPEKLLERIIEASSEPGDLVADFFCGSGTTAVVAEKTGRRWLACDLGRFAVHTTRKRLLSIPDCRPFDIRNLGAYERQRWQVESGNGALRAYLDTILAFYRAEPVEGFAHLHGRKADRMVHVGATDAPVTIDETEEVMDEMADNGIEACDLLGWEWEMGLHDTITERARRRGLDVRPRQIPREVMERQVTEADAVRFFELALRRPRRPPPGPRGVRGTQGLRDPERGPDPAKGPRAASSRGRISSTTGRSTSTSATRSSTTSGRPIELERTRCSPRRATGTSTRSPDATRSS